MTTVRRYLTHTTDRGTERYGLELSSGEYAALSAQIAFHDLTGEESVVRLCHPAANGRERWAVWFKGEWLLVVFEPSTAKIVTIMPKSVLRKYQWKLPW
jgi:hypothetical protein